MRVPAGACFSPSPLAPLVCNLLPTLPATLPYPAMPPTLLSLMFKISWSMSTFSTSGMTPSPSPSTFPDLCILLQYLPRLAGQTAAITRGTRLQGMQRSDLVPRGWIGRTSTSSLS
eukprot:TRINITY_DN526_c0_g1_i3.p1 TRINITY_DN526_c0_g1~~TRINITY_DN526_c0_g1_i3.p1  ORF type:complete len:116 (-),score=31.52 TRINITY_DN526_c0_g1_i3:232-579(-)